MLSSCFDEEVAALKRTGPVMAPWVGVAAPMCAVVISFLPTWDVARRSGSLAAVAGVGWAEPSGAPVGIVAYPLVGLMLSIYMLRARSPLR